MSSQAKTVNILQSCKSTFTTAKGSYRLQYKLSCVTQPVLLVSRLSEETNSLSGVAAAHILQ